MAITIQGVETAIDEATEAVKKFNGPREQLILEIINPLQEKLKNAVKANIYCSEKKLTAKFKKLERALVAFDGVETLQN